MVKRKLGVRRVVLKPWHRVTDKNHRLTEKREVARLQRVAWKHLAHGCKTNAALVRYTWRRDVGRRGPGKCTRTLHYPSPVRDKYGRWDMKIRMPGLDVVFWHIALYFFFYQRDFPRTAEGWHAWRKDCKKKAVEVNHIGGSPWVVHLDCLELKDKGGRYGNAAEGGAFRKQYAKKRPAHR